MQSPPQPDPSVGTEFQQRRSCCAKGGQDTAQKTKHERQLYAGHHLLRSDVEVEDDLREAATQR